MDISKTNSDDDTQRNLPIVKVGNKNLSAVFLSISEAERKKGIKEHIVSFTPKEAFVLNTFLDTKNYETTAKICAIDVSSVKRYLRRKNIARYLKELIEQAAIKTGTTVNWLMSSLRKTAEGDFNPSDDQKWAFKQIQSYTFSLGAQ